MGILNSKDIRMKASQKADVCFFLNILNCRVLVLFKFCAMYNFYRNVILESRRMFLGIVSKNKSLINI